MSRSLESPRIMQFLILVLVFAIPVSVNAANPAKIFISPAASTVTVGKSVDVSVMVLSNAVPMNAVSGNLTLSPINIVSVSSITDNLIDIWTPGGNPSKVFTNSGGHFEGTIVGAGYKGLAGKLYTIHFKGLKPGTTNLTLAALSVLEANGSGTPMVVTSSNATIKVVAAPVVVAPPVVIAPPADPIVCPTPVESSTTQSTIVLDTTDTNVTDSTQQSDSDTETIPNTPLQRVCDFIGSKSQDLPGLPDKTSLPRIITSLAGLLLGGFLLVRALFASPIALSELPLIPTRMWGLFSVAVGLRKRFVPWGTVYDSVTKQPIDPAIVSVFDETGKEVTQMITDLDGRYGFLLEPGTYSITAGKTNYSFPSRTLQGQKSDEVYNDLYFGGLFKVTADQPIVKLDIPLDPIGFDWNEFQKKKRNLMGFYSKRELIFLRIADFIFYAGFALAVLAIISSITIYNIVVLCLYILFLALRYFGRDPRSYGRIIDSSSSNPLSFAVLTVLTSDRWTTITKKVADGYGRYYCLVPKGTYALTIDKKVQDASYAKVLDNPEVKAKKGIIKTDFRV